MFLTATFESATTQLVAFRLVQIRHAAEMVVVFPVPGPPVIQVSNDRRGMEETSQNAHREQQ
jgi:hypothetical protein